MGTYDAMSYCGGYIMIWVDMAPYGWVCPFLPAGLSDMSDMGRFGLDEWPVLGARPACLAQPFGQNPALVSPGLPGLAAYISWSGACLYRRLGVLAGQGVFDWWEWGVVRLPLVVAPPG